MEIVKQKLEDIVESGDRESPLSEGVEANEEYGV